jgi:hypothetical protein
VTVIGNIEKAATNSTKSLDDMIGTYKKRLDRTLRATENRILDLTTRISLDVKGNVKGPKWTLAQTARIQGQLEGIFDENYGKVSRQFAGDIGGVTKIVKKAHNAVDLPIQYSKTDMKMFKNLQEQTLIGLQAFSAQTQERIAQSIQDAIIAGKPYRKLTNEIKNHITGLTDIAGRPLKQYAGVYAQDGLMNAYRSLSMQKAKEIKIKHFVWMGNVVAGTRPMCANSAGQAFTEQELQELDLSTWAGKSCSVFACCGGWNCRHVLMPISDSYFKELKGEPIEVPNWFTEHRKPIPTVEMKIISPKTYKKDLKAIGLTIDKAKQLRIKRMVDIPVKKIGPIGSHLGNIDVVPAPAEVFGGKGGIVVFDFAGKKFFAKEMRFGDIKSFQREATAAKAMHEVGLGKYTPRIYTVNAIHEGKTTRMIAAELQKNSTSIASVEMFERYKLLAKTSDAVKERLILQDYLMSAWDRSASNILVHRKTGAISMIDYEMAFKDMAPHWNRHELMQFLGKKKMVTEGPDGIKFVLRSHGKGGSAGYKFNTKILKKTINSADDIIIAIKSMDISDSLKNDWIKVVSERQKELHKLIEVPKPIPLVKPKVLGDIIPSSKATAKEIAEQYEKSAKAITATKKPVDLKIAVTKRLGKKMDDLKLKEWDDFAAWAYEIEPGFLPSAELSEKATKVLIREWAATSGGENPRSILMQLAARKEFGLEGTSMWWKKEALDKATEVFKTHEIAARRFLREIYNDTQEYLAKQGLKTVRVARGYRGDIGIAPSTIKNKMSKIDIQLQPMSSFSSNIGTAQDFTLGSNKQSLLFAEVPANRVLSCPVTGFGCKDELEWVILGSQREGEKMLGSMVLRSKVALDIPWYNLFGLPDDFGKNVTKEIFKRTK